MTTSDVFLGTRRNCNGCAIPAEGSLHCAERTAFGSVRTANATNSSEFSVSFSFAAAVRLDTLADRNRPKHGRGCVVSLRRPWHRRLLLFQHQIDHPTTPNVRALAPAVVQQCLILASGILK